MPSPTAATPARPALWDEIVGITREACLLRQEGREKEAVALLQQTLPPVIRQWSNTCGQTPEHCREELRSLFAREQQTARAVTLQRRRIVEEVCARLQAHPRTSDAMERRTGTKVAATPIQLQRRVPIDDVVGMLDALQQVEHTVMDEAIVPLRSNYTSLSSAGHRSIPIAAVD